VIRGSAGLLHPLHVVRIPNALPVQTPQSLTTWLQRRENLSPGLFLSRRPGWQRKPAERHGKRRHLCRVRPMVPEELRVITAGR